jgi:hypothetical protein
LFGIILPANDEEPLEKKFRWDARKTRTGADQWRLAPDFITVHAQVVILLR